MIMPLASRADKVTQVQWGLEDFRQRFGRRGRGHVAAGDRGGRRDARGAGRGRREVHHPGALAGARACGGWAPRRGTRWASAIDPSRAYLWRGPRDLSLAALLLRWAHLARDRLRGAAREQRADGGAASAPPSPRRAPGRSWCTARPTANPSATTAASARWRWPPRCARSGADPHDRGHQLRRRSWRPIRPRTRRRSARGPPGRAPTASSAGGRTAAAASRPDSQQRWRAPLRDTLDWLREQTDAFYEARAGAYLKDVWAARDDYGAVVLDRTPRAARRVLGRPPGGARSTADARLQARRLLELQRNRMLMYTSCGWFFDEISGLEPVQILKYAAIVMQYLRDLGGGRTWSPSSSAGWRRRPATWPTTPTAPRSIAGWSRR